MYIKAVSRLNEDQIAAIRNLETACRLCDGTSGMLFLENSLNFYENMPCFFLLYEGGELLGVLSVFAPLPATAEISAYVLPSRRRQGLFKRLLREAVEGLQSYGILSVLFVHEHKGRDAYSMIDRWPIQWDHAEYSLVLGMDDPKALPKRDEALVVRPVKQSDIKEIAGLSCKVFGDSGIAESMAQKSYDDSDVLCFCAAMGDEMIGVCNARIAEEEASIFGFGVSPAYQDKGIGRTFLYHVIDILKGYHRYITLEVDSNNQRALHLYTTSGFIVRAQFDYYQCGFEDIPLP